MYIAVPRQNCKKIYDELDESDRKSGLYMINPDPLKGDFVVYCDMKLAGGGWTVIFRRVDGSLDFRVGWEDYKTGFGKFGGNFWLGLEKIRMLTSNAKMELWIGMESYETPNSDNWRPLDTWRHALYKNVAIGDEASHYTLTVGEYDRANSSVNDTFSYIHNGRKFTRCLFDGHYGGGWWYKSCSDSSLTGVYYNTKDVTGGAGGISWEGWYGKQVSLKTVVLAVRPRSLPPTD